MAIARSFIKPSFIRRSTITAKFPIRAIRSANYDVAQGPYCVLVGPIESERKETLEALYSQARDAYYSGHPIILDDMFDRVELKLRMYGSKSIVKYPRCSIRRQSAYSDAVEDPPQTVVLACIWMLILTFGSSACLLPVIYVVGLAYEHVLSSEVSRGGQLAGMEFFSIVNGILVIMLGCAIGFPVASASIEVLHGLWRKDLVALRGACPNCGEEVFAFLKSDKSISNPHRASCHICDCSLEFRTKIEIPQSKSWERLVYGRIHLVKQ